MRKKVLFICITCLILVGLVFSACGPAVNINETVQNTETISEDDVDNEDSTGEPQEESSDETEGEEASEESSEVEETEPTVAAFALSAEPDSLDPHKTSATVSETVLSLIGSFLLDMDPDGNLVPYLAESWEVSDDGLTYTFHLRDDVLFHNGTPMTAQDLKYTYERAMDPEIASPMAGDGLGPVDTIETPDDYTLVINLLQPYFPFLSSISGKGYYIPLSQAWVEENGEEMLARQPISVGPYKITEYVTGDHITLEANKDFNWGPEYYGSGPFKIDVINAEIILEQSTILAGLEAGEIDFARVEQKDVAMFEDLGFNILTAPQQGLRPYVAMNVAVEPFNDVNVRIALNKAIDRQAALELLVNGNGEVQLGPLSSSQLGYWEGVEEVGYGYDPEGAKALLEESGYELNDDGFYEKDGELLSLTLITAPIEEWRKPAEVIQSMLQQQGIMVEISLEDDAVAFPKMVTGEYDMAVWGVTYPDADILYYLFHSDMIGGLNYHHVMDPELDEMINLTRTLVDPDERQQAVIAAQTRIAEQAYVIPLFSPVNHTVINPRVKGYVFNPMIGIYLNSAYIEEESN